MGPPAVTASAEEEVVSVENVNDQDKDGVTVIIETSVDPESSSVQVVDSEPRELSPGKGKGRALERLDGDETPAVTVIVVAV